MRPEVTPAEPLAAGGGRAAHCHVPASFDPERHRGLVQATHRLASAARWLEREVLDEHECHAALAQVAVLDSELRTVAAQLLDGHLRYCLMRAVTEGQRPDEIEQLLGPIRSAFLASRR